MPKLNKKDLIRDREQSALDLGKKEEAVGEAKQGDGFTQEAVAFFRKEMGVDVVAEFKRLKGIGRVPADQLKDRNVLISELNGVADCAFTAYLIFLRARREVELFQIDFDKGLQHLHRTATERVSNWLEAKGGVKKQITKDMVDQQIAADEDLRIQYRELVEGMEERKGIRDACLRMAEEWSARRYTLNAQANLVSAERELVMSSTGRKRIGDE